MNDPTQQPRKLKKPTVYDELYPGRFIKAGELLGRKVTLTIQDIDIEELQGDDGKKIKCIVSFRETEKKLVACKTNGFCIKSMFGPKLADWPGKRIAIFPDTWNNEPCIRIWGSPDIERDLEVEISLPRRRPFKKTLHALAPKKNGAASPGATLPPLPQSTEMLRGTKSVADLQIAKESIWNLYAAAGQEVPIELEAAANDHAEALAQGDPLGL